MAKGRRGKRRDEVADALKQSFVSDRVPSGYDNIPANLVDVLDRLSRSIVTLANAIDRAGGANHR